MSCPDSPMRMTASVTQIVRNARLKRALVLMQRGRTSRSFKTIGALARRGLPAAQIELAKCYLSGHPIPRSRQDAMMWLERASRADHAEAQGMLAALLASDEGDNFTGLTALPNQATLPSSARSAMNWAKRAAANGSGEGCAVLALLLGRETPQLDVAVEWARQSEQRGCKEGFLVLGILLLNSGSEKDRCEAETKLRLASDLGSPAATYFLGLAIEGDASLDRSCAAAACFESAAIAGIAAAQLRCGLALTKGRTSRKDVARGLTWMRTAAARGLSQAAVALGEYARDSERNEVEAARWFETAAEMGDGKGAFELARLYTHSAGIEADGLVACHWYQTALALGEIRAFPEILRLARQINEVSSSIERWFSQINSESASHSTRNAFVKGLCLAYGLGCEADPAAARIWLERGASSSASAMFQFGRMLALGDCISSDPSSARNCLHKASEAGVIEAKALLAEMYLNGRGGERSIENAIKLFEQAGRRGHAGSCFALGAIFAGGHGVLPDFDVAHRWLQQASRDGHPLAPDMLAKLNEFRGR